MTSEKHNQAPETGIVIRAALAEAEAATAAVEIDPREIPRAAYSRIARMSFPTPERERQAARIVAGHVPRINELIRNGSDRGSICREVAAMEEACRRLTIPEKAIGFQDMLRMSIGQLLNMSWSTEEAETLRYLWRDGDRLSGEGITPSGVQLTNRKITRAQVRDEMAKRGWSKGVLAQHAAVEKERLRIDAENVERAKLGLGAIHYTGGEVTRSRF